MAREYDPEDDARAERDAIIQQNARLERERQEQERLELELERNRERERNRLKERAEHEESLRAAREIAERENRNFEW